MSSASNEVSSPNSGQALPPGSVLEEFTIGRVLGSGGFGITYLAEDCRLGRPVVVKENLPVQFCWREPSSMTVRPRHTEGGDAESFAWSLENFEKEAAMLASLDHPGIVRVLRSFEAFGTAFFVMPFVEGTAMDEQIKRRLENGAAFSEEELLGVLWRMLEALEYLHARGIYHRDIKPGNILITGDGIPVLIDFGSARQRLSERSLTVIESPGYTPFEQLQSRGKIGPWSDLYAMAGTFYKAITGETPPKATDRVMDDPIEPLATRASLQGKYSHRFLASIDRAMAPNSDARFSNSREWRESVWGGDEVSEEKPLEQPPESAVVEASAVGGWEEQSDVPEAQVHSASVDGGDFSFRKGEPSPKRKPVLGMVIGLVAVGVLALVVFIYAVTRPAEPPEGWDATSASEEEIDRYAEVGKAKAAKKKLQAEADRKAEAERKAKEKRKADKLAEEAEKGRLAEEKRMAELVWQKAFTNSLGMKMVPVPGTEVLFCEHETRVQDYAAYAKENSGVDMLWKDYEENGYGQGANHPVVNVNWKDAKGFCEWLSKKEGKNYRLPTDHEWSVAVGIGDREDATASPKDKNGKIEGEFPWGTEFPPPKGAGNYSGSESASDSRNAEYRDEHAFTSPVKSYEVNKNGLYDLGGNVWERCEDWSSSEQKYLVSRGGSWLNHSEGSILSSFRRGDSPSYGGLSSLSSLSHLESRFSSLGFRLVVENASIGGAPSALAKPKIPMKEKPIVVEEIQYQEEERANSLELMISFPTTAEAIMPNSWLAEPISAEIAPLDSTDHNRAIQLLSEELRKYPVDLLDASLKSLHVVGDLRFHGRNYGGVNLKKGRALVLVFKHSFEEGGFQQAFHREFSSLLFAQNLEKFDSDRWIEGNGNGIVYGTLSLIDEGSEDGSNAVTREMDSADEEGANPSETLTLNPDLMSLGFLNRFSTVSIEEDVNEVMANLMTNPSIWRICDQYPRISAKVGVLIDFLSKIDPKLDKEFFQAFANRRIVSDIKTE